MATIDESGKARLVGELEQLGREAAHVCSELYRAYERLSACSAPGEAWDADLRPAREQLCRFRRSLRLVRRSYREFFGSDSADLRRVGWCARAIAWDLSRLKRGPARPAALEDFQERVELLKNLCDLSWLMLREVKLVWKSTRLP